jgi:hypothetical protein
LPPRWHLRDIFKGVDKMYNEKQSTLTYDDIIRKLHDLKGLALPPMEGERSGNFSSFDRSSVYNEETDVYENWGANDDGSGYIRKEGNSIVIFETDGPGIIWRLWYALPSKGILKYLLTTS